MMVAAAADGRFDVVLMVYNFIQKEAGERAIKALHEKNIGITLMKTNPVGGYLGLKERADAMKKEGKKIPPYYEKILAKLKAKADQADEFVKKHKLNNPSEIRDAAIKFVLNHPHVAAVCCSLVNFDQVEGFVKLSGIPATPLEKKKLSLYKEGCGSLYCRHACGACEPSCPHNVPVNTIMRYNHYFEAQGREKHALQKYANLTTPKADKCLTCTGHCEATCPYGVPVHGLLTLAHHRLTLA
jgi:predicted aldo/keto reductase-like oxidoreductase